MEIGNNVKLVTPAIEGVIKDTQYNKSVKELEHLVEWTNSNNEVHSRWFLESDLEDIVPVTGGTAK